MDLPICLLTLKNLPKNILFWANHYYQWDLNDVCKAWLSASSKLALIRLAATQPRKLVIFYMITCNKFLYIWKKESTCFNPWIWWNGHSFSFRISMVIITGKRNSIFIAKVSLQIVKVFFFRGVPTKN